MLITTSLILVVHAYVLVNRCVPISVDYLLLLWLLLFLFVGFHGRGVDYWCSSSCVDAAVVICEGSLLNYYRQCYQQQQRSGSCSGDNAIKYSASFVIYIYLI